MRGFWKRGGRGTELEARLRDERPVPGEAFVSRTTAGVPDAGVKPRPQRRIRFGFAGAITVAVLTVAVLLGGAFSPVKPIADGIERATSSNSNKDKDKDKGKGKGKGDASSGDAEADEGDADADKE